MQKCDEIFDFATPSSGGMAVISEKGFTHKTPNMRLTLLAKLRKIKDYFSSELKTDGNVVFDPLCDCCDHLHSYQLIRAKVENSNPNC